MKYRETRIDERGLMRCCIKTIHDIVEAMPDSDIVVGLSDCAYEREGNRNIALRSTGIWASTLMVGLGCISKDLTAATPVPKLEIGAEGSGGAVIEENTEEKVGKDEIRYWTCACDGMGGPQPHEWDDGKCSVCGQISPKVLTPRAEVKSNALNAVVDSMSFDEYKKLRQKQCRLVIRLSEGDSEWQVENVVTEKEWPHTATLSGDVLFESDSVIACEAFIRAYRG